MMTSLRSALSTSVTVASTLTTEPHSHCQRHNEYSGLGLYMYLKYIILIPNSDNHRGNFPNIILESYIRYKYTTNSTISALIEGQ